MTSQIIEYNNKSIKLKFDNKIFNGDTKILEKKVSEHAENGKLCIFLLSKGTVNSDMGLILYKDIIQPLVESGIFREM